MVNRILVGVVSIVLLWSCGSSDAVVSNTSVKKQIKTVNHTKPITKTKKEQKEPVSPTKAEQVVKEEVLTSTSRTVVSKDVVYNYIQKYKHIAMQNMRDYKIPASIILAQGVLESGSGRGSLSKRSNNHFGIKCHKGWTGQTTTHDDDKKGECFRKYDDPAESYRDHALFLTSRKRYAGLFELDIKNYKKWARGLRAAGYATDPKYPQKLISLIERYNLYEYDSIALGESKPKEQEVVVTEVKQKQEVKKKEDTRPVTPKEYVDTKINEEPAVAKDKVVKTTELPTNSTREKVIPFVQISVNPETNEKEFVVNSRPEEDVSEFEEETEVQTQNQSVLGVISDAKEEQKIVEETIDEIIVPTEKKEIIKEAVVHTNDAQSGEYKEIGNHNLYKVAKGDTVYSISRKLGVSIDQIVSLNKLQDYSIAIGQILRIK